MTSWWHQKKNHRGTPVVIKMDNPNYSISEVELPTSSSSSSSSDDEDDILSRKKERMHGKNAKQLTWILLLKANRAAGFVSSFVSAIHYRVKPSLGGGSGLTRVNSLVRLLLYLCFALLVLDWVATGVKGVRFRVWFDLVCDKWVVVRVGWLAPVLQWVANGCVILFIVQSLDRLVLCLGCFWIRFRKIKPVAEVGCGDLEGGDGGGYFPMVLVQMPMCNEREVYQQSIGAVCKLEWPKSRLLIQVLDDSDDPATQMLIKEEVDKWEGEGVNIIYRHRVDRGGYKAGNLKSAMACSYVQDYEFVAIFDADFQPAPDFLRRTVIHFKGKEDVGLVQARWSFINKDENLLTRLQYINISFHFEVEQQVNGIFLNFFGFNGTAGVWRIKALEESGGWLERTTVEDMDIAVRAHLKGWKFVFLNDVECQCELPESYEAYRKQQHRWHSGPMQLFRLCLPDVIKAKISIWKKANMIFLFFLLRKLILPFYSFTLFCIILPITIFVPEAELPIWVICYVPLTMSLLNILPSPKSFPFIVPYLLFENTMSVTKFNAMISGLFQLTSAHEWVVTKKSGRSSEGDLVDLSKKEENLAKKKKDKKTKQKKVYMKEVSLALLLLTAAVKSLVSAHGVHFYFLLFQGISFLLVGLDLIGEQAN